MTQDTNNPRIQYSYCTGGATGTRMVNVACTWQEFVDKWFNEPYALDVSEEEYASLPNAQRGKVKKALPYIVGCTFDPPRRSDTNVQGRWLLTLDIEAKAANAAQPPALGVVAKRAKALGLACAIHATISHTKAAPRYRVYMPLHKTLQGVAHVRAATIAAAELLEVEHWLAPESYVLSQPMFVPTEFKGGTVWVHTQGGPAANTNQLTASAVFGAAGGIERRVSGVTPGNPDDGAVADPVLDALRAAGRVLGPHPKHTGAWCVRCVNWEDHGNQDEDNWTQTVYYPAHTGGHAEAALHCMDCGSAERGGHSPTVRATLLGLLDHGEIDEGTAEHALATTSKLTAVKAGKGIAAEDFLYDSVSELLDTEPQPAQWLFKDVLPCGELAVLAASGGTGKSFLMLQLAMHYAMGRSWGPFEVNPATAGRVAVISAEDNRASMHRRIATLRTHLPSTPTSKEEYTRMRANLRIPDMEGRIEPLIRQVRNEVVETGYMQQLEDAIAADPTLRLLVLDPLVFMHELNENDNMAMGRMVRRLAGMCHTHNVTILLVHHFSKETVVAGSLGIGSIREASALVDNARCAWLMATMGRDEAAAWGVNSDDHGQWVRWVAAKNSYGPSGQSAWFQRGGNGALQVPAQQPVHTPAVPRGNRGGVQHLVPNGTLGPVEMLPKTKEEIKADNKREANAAVLLTMLEDAEKGHKQGVSYSELLAAVSIEKGVGINRVKHAIRELVEVKKHIGCVHRQGSKAQGYVLTDKGLRAAKNLRTADRVALSGADNALMFRQSDDDILS